LAFQTGPAHALLVDKKKSGFQSQFSEQIFFFEHTVVGISSSFFKNRLDQF
jgi:hypothetical protein